MGHEARCTLTTDGRTSAGVARLEHKDLIFKGDARLAIPLKDIHEIHAREGSLFVTFGVQRAVFEIGKDAEKWAKRIGHPPSRLDKLGVKPGMVAAVVSVDDRELAGELASRGAVVDRTGRRTGCDLIFFGVRSRDDLKKLAAMKSRLVPTGALWLIREKGKTAVVSEMESMAAGKRAGLVDVKVVSFSETHTAEKYVIPTAARRRAGAGRSSALSPRTRVSPSSRDRI